MEVTLNSGELRVGIDVPPGEYTTSRFDWGTRVTSILLHDTVEFASRETLDPASQGIRGRGLSCEFGIRAAIGYDDCPVGEWFPKIGVGWVRRESDKPYDFYTPAKELEPAKSSATVAKDGTSLSINMQSGERRGYAWELQRVWKLEGRRVRSECILSNHGKKPLTTDEYCHNFLVLGDAGPGPSYDISFGFPVAKRPASSWDHCGCVEFPEYDAPKFTHVASEQYYGGGFLKKPHVDAWWKIEDAGRSLWMQETLEATCVGVDIWGSAHVISPEMFVSLNVLPGESFAWAREWSFGG